MKTLSLPAARAAKRAVPELAEVRSAVSNTLKVASRWSIDVICLTVACLAIAVMMLGFVHANLPLIILSSGTALLACLAAMEAGSEKKGGAK